nr:MAG TPA: hypothetical protein [Caudoviricetes sp.]
MTAFFCFCHVKIAVIFTTCSHRIIFHNLY